ncbi:MAG TPA: PEP/pyruvate-binding domain-containing protein [Rubrobacter sp.]|nr:PEP/pyruvate-binding domain-containing protein [Rubrobacter sp.]
MNGPENGDPRLILPFTAIDRGALAVAGGKAANLGELVLAGFPVPAGFCITTAAYDLVAADAGLEPTLAALAGTQPEDTARLAELAKEARSCLSDASVPDVLGRVIAEAYGKLGDGAPVPVAVRSSATAEDLPQASFAGQQDTYLNVVGVESVLDAVRRCWASLWTDRAVTYRTTNGIDPHSVRLAVAVQQMVDASVAGVLFTANPVTGKRRQTVIDASPGLGEAVVSGRVNPDHFVANTATGEIVERRLGDKRVAIMAGSGGGTERVELDAGEDRASLSDGQVLALARLGARVEEHYGTPQDTEWAIEDDGGIWLLQARPITTLFPLPERAPTNDEDLRVYFSFSVAQGVYRPLTPMGIQAFRLITSALATLAGRPSRDPYEGAAFFAESAGRIFADITPVLRSEQGRGLFEWAMRHMEARTVPIVRHLAADPRLAPVPTFIRPVLHAVLSVFVRGRIPLRFVEALARPEKARARAARVEAQFRAADDVPPDAGAAERLSAAERLLRSGPPDMLPNVPPVFAAGLAANALAGKLLGGLASEDERRVAMRALPHNPTTEMDLALWALAKEARADPDIARMLSETPPERLAEDYRGGSLPPKLQTSLADFLRLYGHRGVAEIDLGLSRWSEDPTYIMGVLANYLRLDDPQAAPDVQFGRATRKAEEMVGELIRRAANKGRMRGATVRFLLGRARELSGLREMPKFCIILLMARARELLWTVGAELAEAGRLQGAGDIFFLSVPEAWAVLAGEDLRPLVSERRAVYEQELRRRHVPRLLLSDGTEPTAGTHHATGADGALRGTPASGGVVTERARVILDPGEASLEPGEILVAPSTDPGWTPLFLTAGGLVMEMGGPMSHGAIVAREYGIPAVVGVPDATEHIETGRRITVDGSAGEVTLDLEGAESV